jgi:predicted phosphodiesterase
MKKTVVLSDIHIPNHCPLAVSSVLKFIRDFKPDQIILNGDILDMEGISSHGRAFDQATVAFEVEVGARFLDELQKRSPKASIHFIEGNHEQRVSKFIKSEAYQLQGLISLPDLLMLPERGISWLPHAADQILWITPKLGVTHGSFYNTHYAHATLTRYGVSLLIGHGHRVQVSSAPTVGKSGQQVRICYANGCLTDIQAPYQRTPSGWLQAFQVVLSDEETGFFNVFPVVMTDHSFYWVDGKRYAPDADGWTGLC